MPTAMSRKPIEIDGPEAARDFRNALGGFVTGVTVVTTQIDGKPCGFTANSFSSVSLNPPLVLFCIGKSSSNWENFSKTDRFGINILSESQRGIAQQFARRGVDRFEGVAWDEGILGNPVIRDSASWFECSLHARHDAGDHEIIVGRVEDYGYTTGSPLAYCRGNYVLFELERDIASHSNRRERFSIVLEGPDGIILEASGADGGLSLPRAKSIGTRDGKDGLYGHLLSMGIEFDIEFLFSVWEDEAADAINVVYRGTASKGPTAPGAVSFRLSEIPYDRLNETDGKLLRRYADERANHNFSVYSGTTTKGDWLRVPADQGSK